MMTLHKSHKQLNSAIVSSVLSLEASSPFSPMCPCGVILNLIVTYSGWVCLFLSEAFSRTEYKIQEVLHLSSREQYLLFMTKSASCKMVAIRTSQRTLAPPQCSVGPSLQTPNLSAYLASSDISHSAPSGFTVNEISQANFQVASCNFFLFIFLQLIYWTMGSILGSILGNKMFRGLKTGDSLFRATVPTHHLYKQWIQSPWGPFMSWSWA